MLLPRAVIQSLYHSARVMAAATSAAPAQAKIRSGLAVPITGALQPRSSQGTGRIKKA